MKIISFTSRCKDSCLHVETDLGIVNIKIGLTDLKGRRVEHIEIVNPSYAGENKVVIRGSSNTRLIELKTVKN